MHTPHIKTDYLGSVFDKKALDKFLKQAKTLVKQYDFQAFAFRGMSGALVAPLLAHKTGKSLIMVRKPRTINSDGTVSHHSYLQVEGDQAALRYIILDDEIATGRTVSAIVEQISIFAPDAKCIGCLLYQDFLRWGASPVIKRPYQVSEHLQKYLLDPEDCHA